MATLRNLRGQILALADAYEASGRRLGGVGHMINNDGKFFARLRAGGALRTDKYERLIAWFDENWPDDEVQWPTSVPRPQHDRSAA